MDILKSLPGFRVRLIGLAVVLLAVLAGCGGVKKINVSGTVKYKGQPVRSGILKFIGPGTNSSLTGINDDGTFTMTDVVPGDVKVAILEGAPPGTADPKAPVPVPLPEKLRDPETSGLKYTITPDTRNLEIDIK